jgi:hypothetical protein
MTPPDLPTLRTLVQLQREFSDLFAQLSVLPYGSTQNYNASGGKSCEHPGGKRPAGESHPEALKALEAWGEARWHEGRMRAVLQMMRDDLKHWKHSAKVVVKEETLVVLYRRIRDEGEGWAVADVARALKVTERQVRKARAEGGLHPETGKERVMPAALSPDQRKARVVELVGQGWKAKNVAMHLGVAYKTVLRDLEAA